MAKPTYTPTTWVNNANPALSADNLNHIEQGVSAVTSYAASSVQSIVAGTGVTVNNTDPANPVVTATGGGSGTVDSVAASDSTITVDNTDPANPKVKVTAGTFDAAGAAAAAQTAAEAASVPTSRTVNGHALSANVTLAASDVGAVPTATTVNGHALTGNVTVTASDLSLATVATSGSYTDLSSTPSIPATAADVGAAPMVVASGASAVRFTGTGTTLPTSGQQTGDVFFLTS